MSEPAVSRPFAELEAAIAYRFARPELLREALTHPSAVSLGRHPRSRRRSYQRLEFLGDRVLGLIVADLLIRHFPEEAEGALTHRFTVLVRKDTLAQVAGQLGLERWIVSALSKAESVGRPVVTMLGDACEALIGAIYLDGGLEAARAFVQARWQPLIEGAAEPPRDAKMALQEWTLGRGMGAPTYRVVETAGPAHATIFTVEASIGDAVPVRASGSTKRAAEKQAARMLLEQLERSAHG